MKKQEKTAPKCDEYQVSNKFLVQEALDDNNTSIGLSTKKMADLKIFRGDVIFIKGNKRKQTLAVALTDKKLQNNKIRMNETIRKNLGISLGDTVQIKHAGEVPILNKIHILPLADTITSEKDNIPFLTAYFRDQYRPIKKGDLFRVRNSEEERQFKVVATASGQYGIVAPHTMLYTEGDPIERERESMGKEVDFDDIGGYERQIMKIKQSIMLSLYNSQIFQNLGVKKSKGLLLYGPPGTGKTMIVKAMQNQIDVFFFLINGPEIMSKMCGQAESNLRKAFEEAQKNSPSIIFIDQIDSIARKRGRQSEGQVQKRVVSQLLTEMDGFKEKGKIFVIGETNRPDDLDPALRRFGRFDQQIEIGVPDEIDRLKILKVQTKKMKLNKSVDLKKIAKNTDGFVGADLAALCYEATLQSIRKVITIYTEKISKNILSNQWVTQQNFQSALKEIIPASSRSIFTQAYRGEKEG